MTDSALPTAIVLPFPKTARPSDAEVRRTMDAISDWAPRKQVSFLMFKLRTVAMALGHVDPCGDGYSLTRARRTEADAGFYQLFKDAERLWESIHELQKRLEREKRISRTLRARVKAQAGKTAMAAEQREPDEEGRAP
jgi:hypothetical protein